MTEQPSSPAALPPAELPRPRLVAAGPRSMQRLGAKLALAIVGLGLLVIGIAWLEASGTGGQVRGVTTITAQFPYLISGGCLGIALCTLGAALLVAQSQRRDREQLEASLGAKLDDIATLLREGAVLASPSPATGRRGEATAVTPLRAVPGPDLVVAGASAYHLSTCRLAQGKGAALQTREESVQQGLRPCRYCSPG